MRWASSASVFHGPRPASAEARNRRALEEAGHVRGERNVRIFIEDSLGQGGVIDARQFEQDEGRWSRFHVRGHYPVLPNGMGKIVAKIIGGNS